MMMTVPITDNTVMTAEFQMYGPTAPNASP